MHYVGRFREEELPPPAELYGGQIQGLRQRMLIDRSIGASHMYLMVNQLEPGGKLDAHIHAFEEGYFFLSGEMIGMIDEHAYHFVPGDYCIVQVATPHAWRNPGQVPVRWIEVFAPQPSETGHGRRVPVRLDSAPTSGERIAGLGPRAKYVGHFDERELPPPSTHTGGHQVAQTSLPLVDRALGAQHLQTLMVEIGPGGKSDAQEHPYEEAYFMLQGSIEVTFEGKEYLLEPGNIGWTGVGALHSFHNRGKSPAQWLAVRAPQPPAQQWIRFPEDWQRLEEEQARKLAPA